MIDAIINLQPEIIGAIMIAVMLFAIFIGFPFRQFIDHLQFVRLIRKEDFGFGNRHR